MTARLVRRSVAIALALLIVVDAVALLYALSVTSDLRIPGARIAVDEVPGESLSADFSIEPVEALVAWVVLTGLVLLVLRRIDRSSSRR